MGQRRCCIPNCHSKSGDSDGFSQKLSFHRFPFKYPSLLDKWLKKIGRPDWYPTATSRICGSHFMPYHFLYRFGVCHLRKNAVPEIFPDKKILKLTKKSINFLHTHQPFISRSVSQNTTILHCDKRKCRHKTKLSQLRPKLKYLKRKVADLQKEIAFGKVLQRQKDDEIIELKSKLH